MIVDSSALIAILKGEPESEAFIRAIVDATSAKIAAGTLLEAALVVDGLRDAVRSRRFDELVRTLGLEVVSDHGRPRRDRPVGIPRFRQGQRASGGTQLRRLLRLCLGQ